jgi:hypothetical protein
MTGDVVAGRRYLLADGKTIVYVDAVDDIEVHWQAEDGRTGSTLIAAFRALVEPAPGR